MVAIEYRRRFPRTLGQVVFQCAVAAIILQPPLAWRLVNERIVVSMALFGLTLATLALAYQGVRFLVKQELEHPQPTPEMAFVFMLVAVYPVAMSVFLLILLTEM
jgi:hypothetical protein